jgi:serine/threonine protein kinase
MVAIYICVQSSIKLDENKENAQGCLKNLIEEQKVNVEIGDIFWSLAVGLKYLHENNVIHGHLDLSNVLLFKIGERRVIKLTNYGLHRWNRTNEVN